MEEIDYAWYDDAHKHEGIRVLETEQVEQGEQDANTGANTINNGERVKPGTQSICSEGILRPIRLSGHLNSDYP